MRKAWKFFQRDLLIDSWSRFPLILHLLNIGLTVAAYVFLARLVERDTLARWTSTGGDYFAFVLIGMAASAAMLLGITGLSRSLQLAQPSGVLKPLLFGRTPLETVLAGSSLYPMARAGADFAAYILVGWLAGGISLAQANLGGALLVGIPSLVAFCGLGILAAAFSVLFRCGEPFLWVIGSSSWLLGGVLYPPSVLPGPLRWAAEVFPLTHALRGMRRALLEGASIEELIPSAAVLCAFSLVVIPLGVLAFRIGLLRARRLGTLSEW